MNLKIENKVVNIDENLKNLIKSQVEGEVYFDEITREIYSTDASIYRIVPLCVDTQDSKWRKSISANFKWIFHSNFT